MVALVDRALLELALEQRVRALRLGDDHQAGGADVEPVHDALALGGAGGGDAVAGGGEPADDGRCRSSRGCGWAATPTGLTITTMSSSSCTISMPSTGSATICTGAGACGISTSSQAPPCTRSDFPTTDAVDRAPSPRRPARRPWCGRSRTCGRWRRRRARPPGRRARAGCGSRESCSPVEYAGRPGARTAPWTTARPRRRQSLWTVPSGSRPLKDSSTIRMPPHTIAESARLKTAKCVGRDEVDDRALEDARRAEDPVGEVAERAAEQQAERDRPGQAVELAGEPGDHHDHRRRDHREDRR